MSPAQLEIELKYGADAGALASLAAAERIGPAALGPPILNLETDHYLDTADRRLAAAAWACRLRTRRVDGRATTFVSIKGPLESGAGALHHRTELEGPGDGLDPAAWPPSEARALVDRLRDGLPLETRFTLKQRRRERPVALAAGIVGTLSLDEATVLRGGRRLGELRVVELELAPGADPAHLAELGRNLERLDGLTPDQRSKLEHALEMIAADEAGH